MTVQVHPQGLCESTDVGARTRVWAFAHVMAGARVGRDCNIGDHAFIESGAVIGDRVTVKNAVLVWEGVTVEDDVFLGPAVVFTNHLRPRTGAELFHPAPTLVRQGASIGASATIICGTTIGRCSFIAAGAVVARDVLDHAFVVGVPAVQRGWVCSCGRQLDADLACPCGSRYVAAAGGLVPA